MTTTAFSSEVESTPPAPPRPSPLRARFLPADPTPAWIAWLGAVLVAAFAGALRFVGFGEPPRIYFDETYYAKDAYGLLNYGYEHETVEEPVDADALLQDGATADIFTGGGDFIVHPPVGKWMIALGDLLWGALPFGESMTPEAWRFASVLAGIASVLILVRVATRMTRSVLLGCTAGVILALDGLHFTLSRVAMLDIFLTLWILAGFACLVIDRDKTRERLVRLAEAGVDAASVGWLGMRWWRLAAGLCFGLAVGTKWSALFFIAAFGLLTVAWDYGARSSAGQKRPGLRWLGFDAIPAFVQTVMVAGIVYLVSWSGWLFTRGGYNRDYADGLAPDFLPGFLAAPVEALLSLWNYHTRMMGFHENLSSDHTYISQPWEWIIMRMPVMFHYNGEAVGCPSGDCVTSIVSIGTPVVWWLSILALTVLVGWWVTFRDWRAGAVLLGVAAGWLPWFAFPDRPMFLFYALPMLPFLVLAIVLMLGLVMGAGEESPRFSPYLRALGGIVFGVVMLLIIAHFAYLYPVLAAYPLDQEMWDERLWFRVWIYGRDALA
ncbi:dolichyl-phosphate-mannose--protein mannosyltransferase [Nocardiopsis changdeensis]|uniref:Polyprenol-phosphate-mannose--protein mannosyltransferase n=1 Tax=Nocardiopsis changdeensis TaxID=2831969 RepID=A0ABX8BRX7_9ACTN|nr:MULTISPECIES: phospholipid carrier-dependent glycosyltransferase [Nocardiopsis]QUX23586.1 phospholipid carrier-dependent glycosyltransferase [Nocardiopsis changdeensis]QYX39530.1 phospholipid carrier-dependent glycosyltransferase [Nocardiopsis sp. MT53]